MGKLAALQKGILGMGGQPEALPRPAHLGLHMWATHSGGSNSQLGKKLAI